MRRDGHFHGFYNISGVHAFVELHDGDAGLRFPVDDGSLDRRGAAVLGKQRCVHIDGPIGGDIQHRLRQDAAVSDDHQDVRLQGGKCFYFFLVFESERLIHRDVVGKGERFHRGKGDLFAATIDFVRLGIDGHRRVAMATQGFQGGQAEIRRAHENDSFILHLSAPCEEKSLFR